MLPFKTIIIIDKNARVPVYQQIANGIINVIRDGMIQPGARLPGTRDLAAQLRVHRKTVIAAYDELYAQSWTEVSERKAVRVAGSLPELKPGIWDKRGADQYGTAVPGSFYPVKAAPYLTNDPGPHDFVIDDGLCDIRLAPMDLLLREYRTAMGRNRKQKMVFGTLAAGARSLREALVPYFAETRGLNISIENVLITHGAQMALYLAARLLLRKGDTIIAAEPCYFIATQVFEETGAQLLRVPVDDKGMDLDAVEAACRSQKVRALYVIPHHHHPTTVTMSPERRMRLLELAKVYNFMILEDDYDYDFHYTSSPYLPLAGSRHDGRVIYVGSFSKAIAPSVRVGFMVGPATFIENAIRLRRLIDLRGDHLTEEALAMLIGNGDVSRHLKKANKIYTQRRDHLCTLLERHLSHVVTFEKPAGGMAVWVKFKNGYNLPEIAARAAKLRLYLSSGVMFNTATDYNATRFGFASMTEDEISAAIALLVRAVNAN